MIYDASIPFDENSAKERFNWLVKNKRTIELKEKKPRRSISQNAYMHLIFSWFGLEFGYSQQEVKQYIFKQEVNKDIFYEGEKEGVVKVSRWRSSASLDTKEMSLAINRFRDFSAQHGCYLPDSGDLAAINEMERRLLADSSKQYL